MSGAANRRPAPAPSRAVLAALDGHADMIGDGLLRDDEMVGLQAAMPQLAALARTMGVIDKPVIEWTPEEMMRFLCLAVRAAMPINKITHHSADMNDRLPF